MGWNPFKSKKKTVVSSSSFAIFDADKRVRQYPAAMLDYTANSTIEHSEYMKNYLDSSRLRNYRGFLRWWEKNGYFDTFGEMKGQFYGDAQYDNTVVTEAIRKYVSVPPGSILKVYSTNLSAFSENFWLKHLATQQGKTEWFYLEDGNDFTIEYPNEDTIRAYWADGRSIQGSLPNKVPTTRFLEISYSILSESSEEKVTPPVLDEKGNIVEEEKREKIVNITTTYGFLHYQEDSGKPELDHFIKNNGVKLENSFFPVIPIRDDERWLKDEKAKKVSKALDYLQIFGNKKSGEDSYQKLTKILTEGVKEGSLNDLDYITLIPGVAINSNHPSDNKYLYEFFLNAHANSIAAGTNISQVTTPKPRQAYTGRGFFARYRKKALENRYKGSYHSFVVSCPGSHLDLTFWWAGSDFFEANGKWKPGAKVGECGVLSGHFVHKWTETVYVLDQFGQKKYTYVTGRYHDLHRKVRFGKRKVYETKTVHREEPYNMVFFCKQETDNRWSFVAYLDLILTNNVYDGYTVVTDAHDAVKDSSQLGQVTHDFSLDLPSAPGEDKVFTLNFIKVRGDATEAFIVPLEVNTFREIGAIHQLEISYGSQYLVMNCWETYKKRWYQRGFFSIAICFLGVALGSLIPVIGPLVSTFFAVVGTILLTAKTLELTLKVLTLIFGESLGTAIYNWGKKIITTIVCVIVSKIPVIGWAIAAAIMFTITAADVINAGGSLEDAFKKGLASGAMAALGSYAGAYAGGAVASSGASVSVSSSITIGTETLASATQAATYSAINSFGNALIQGKSFGKALKSGVLSGIMSGAMVIGGDVFDQVFDSFNLLSSGSKVPGEAGTNAVTETAKSTVNKQILNPFQEELYKNLSNPNTYANLMKETLAQRQFHKLANMENDYQEFANEYASALRVMEIVSSQVTSTATAEFVCKMQTNAGRMLTQFPELGMDLTPDRFFSMTLTTGSDFCNGTLQGVATFTENKLSIDGYTPEILHYNKEFLTFAT